MTDAIHAYGTTLTKGGVLICELTNIAGLELSSDEIDVTSHCSTGGFEEVIQGIRRTGAVAIEGNFVPSDAGQAAMWTDYQAGTVDTYKITFPTAMAAEWEFDAYVSVPPATEAPVDGKVGFSAELRVTGVPLLNITFSTGLTTPFFSASTGTIVPAPAGDVYYYVVNIATGTATQTLTPTGAGVITVDGNVVASGVASSAITLGAAGSITPVEIVVKETDKIARTYYIDLVRAA